MSFQTVSFPWNAKARSTSGYSVTGVVSNHLAGRSIPFRVEYKSSLDLQVLEKVVARVATETFTNAPLTTEKDYEYHVIEEGNHYLVCVIRAIFKKNWLQIEQISQWNFSQMQTLFAKRRGENLDKQTFLNDLSLMPLVQAEDDPLLPSTSMQCDYSLPQQEIHIDKTITYNMAVFHLSDELIRGMKGERGEDHQFSQEILDFCLRQKLHQFANNIAKDQNIRLVIDFKSKLRLVIDHYVQNPTDEKLHFNIITGYYRH